VTWNDDGVCSEFANSCRHQTAHDAARHAVRRLGDVVHRFGVEAELEEWLPEAAQEFLRG
jgi:hypothetical protein